MRLNRWVRLGIVASVLWALVVGYYTLHTFTELAIENANASRRLCVDAATVDDPKFGERCSEEWMRNFKRGINNSYGHAAIRALAPIPFAWLFVYLAVLIWRWVARGFKREAR